MSSYESCDSSNSEDDWQALDSSNDGEDSPVNDVPKAGIEVEKINEDGAVIVKVDESTAEPGEKVDIRGVGELAGVRSMQSVIYSLYVAGFRVDIGEALLKCLKVYEENETTPLNVKMAEKIYAGLGALVAAEVSIEEAQLLLEDSHHVEHSVVQHLQNFMSITRSSFAIFDDELHVLHTSNNDLAEFMEKEMEKLTSGKMILKSMPVSWVNFAHQSMKDFRKLEEKSGKPCSLFHRITQGVSPFNAFLLGSDRSVIEAEAKRLARTVTQRSAKGLKNKNMLSIKVTSLHPSHALLDMSPQIIKLFEGDIKYSNITQVQYDVTKPAFPVTYDGVTTIFVSEDGKTGDLESLLCVKTPLADLDEHVVLSKKKDEALKIIDGSLKDSVKDFFTQLKTSGVRRVKDKTYLRVDWLNSMSEDDISQGNRIGFTDVATVTGLYAKKAKGKWSGQDPNITINANRFVYIDATTTQMLVIPRSLLKPESGLRAGHPPIGMLYSRTLNNNLPVYGASFFLGVLLKPLEEELTTDHILSVTSNFLKAQTFLKGQKYLEFVGTMVEAMNSFKARVVLRRGSRKGIVDGEVVNYLSLKGWDTEFINEADDEIDGIADDSFDEDDLLL